MIGLFPPWSKHSVLGGGDGVLRKGPTCPCNAGQPVAGECPDAGCEFSGCVVCLERHLYHFIKAALP